MLYNIIKYYQFHYYGKRPRKRSSEKIRNRFTGNQAIFFTGIQ